MRIKYLEERLQAALGDEMTINDYQECLDMLFKMTMAFATVAPEKFAEFYYIDYRLQSEKD